MKALKDIKEKLVGQGTSIDILDILEARTRDHVRQAGQVCHFCPNEAMGGPASLLFASIDGCSICKTIFPGVAPRRKKLVKKKLINGELPNLTHCPCRILSPEYVNRKIRALLKRQPTSQR